MHCIDSSPSTIPKFLNPMASNRCLTISDNSGIYKKHKYNNSMETIQEGKHLSKMVHSLM